MRDFVQAGEIFAKEDVTDAHFVIEPKKRPNEEAQRTYKDGSAFNEVSVMVVEPRGGKVPKRSVERGSAGLQCDGSMCRGARAHRCGAGGSGGARQWADRRGRCAREKKYARRLHWDFRVAARAVTGV